MGVWLRCANCSPAGVRARQEFGRATTEHHLSIALDRRAQGHAPSGVVRTCNTGGTPRAIRCVAAADADLVSAAARLTHPGTDVSTTDPPGAERLQPRGRPTEPPRLRGRRPPGQPHPVVRILTPPGGGTPTDDRHWAVRPPRWVGTPTTHRAPRPARACVPCVRGPPHGFLLQRRRGTHPTDQRRSPAASPTPRRARQRGGAVAAPLPPAAVIVRAAWAPAPRPPARWDLSTRTAERAATATAPAASTSGAAAADAASRPIRHADGRRRRPPVAPRRPRVCIPAGGHAGAAATYGRWQLPPPRAPRLVPTLRGGRQRGTRTRRCRPAFPRAPAAWRAGNDAAAGGASAAPRGPTTACKRSAVHTGGV